MNFKVNDNFFPVIILIIIRFVQHFADVDMKIKDMEH